MLYMMYRYIQLFFAIMMRILSWPQKLMTVGENKAFPVIGGFIYLFSFYFQNIEREMAFIRFWKSKMAIKYRSTMNPWAESSLYSVEPWNALEHWRSVVMVKSSNDSGPSNMQCNIVSQICLNMVVVFYHFCITSRSCTALIWAKLY